MAEESPHPLRRDFLSPSLLVLALLLIALWPGDVSWLLDEPRLIATAWHANHDHQLAVGGLYGNFGIRYGPLPTQIYQVLLLVTHDPFTLVVLRALLCAGVTGGALLWLSRTLSLPGWFVAGVLVSPHVVAYHRVLWDASFAMPVGALALASFADFLRTRRAWSLRACVITSVLVPTIHPQSLPLAAGLLGWLAWQHRPALWSDRRGLCFAGAIVLLLNGYYFVQFAGQLCMRFGGSMQKGYPHGGSHLASALAPLFGGRLLSGADYLQSLARLSAPDWLHVTAQGCSMLIFPLEWIGIGVAVHSAWRTVRTPKAATPRRSVTLVLVAALVLQALLFGAMRIPAAPQYFFGTFPLHVLAALLAVDALRKWRVGTVLGALYVAGSAILTLEAAISIHHHGFERPLWPTLATSVSVVQKLNHFPDTTALTNFAVYKRSPQTLRTLRLLLPAAPTGESGRLLITNDRSAGQPGVIAVTELAPDASPPAGSQQIDTTPLPKDWVPDPSTW
ncbi:MAG: hypothetical protein ABJF10_01560 [Chthoniobacter sp.]|uniref:hypothetical protein n=1 Tax=Chthoniobacter sp. TaxID=2510640 RepID=UPI0032AB5F33